MSTPERRTGQTAWARRQQQQHHNSPFRRAQHVSLNLDASHDLSHPQESSARHRRKFSRTGTLRGAYEVASRLPGEPEDDEDPFLPYHRHSRETLNRKQRRQSTSAMSSYSNPPDELAEAYRQISDAASLTDNPSDDDQHNVLYRDDPDNSRRFTSGSGREQGFFSASDASYTDEPPRRRSIDYTRDEERLRRATTSRSPVLHRAGSSLGLTSENLQRREEEESHGAAEEEEEEEDEDDGIRPSVNLPSTWGSRGRKKSDWMRSLTRNYDTRLGSTPRDTGELSSQLQDASTKFSPRKASKALEVEDDTEEPPANKRYSSSSAGQQGQVLSGQKIETLTGGDHIPNTPITVYKSSTFTKRSPAQRDSQDLLRKLARSGSPSTNQPSKATKTPEGTTTGRRIYDKTPIVTGAWIDTPVTQREQAFRDASLLQSITKGSERSPSKTWRIEESTEEMDHKGDEIPVKTDFKPAWPREIYKPRRESLEEETRSADPIRYTPVEEPLVEEKTEEEKRSREEEDRIIVEELLENEHHGGSDQPEREPQDLPSHRERTEKGKQPLIKPVLPRSALETVLQDYKENKDSLDLGDDTIESLQAIMEEQPTDVKPEEDDAYEQSVMKQLATAKTESLDMGDFERLNRKLQSLSDNIARVKTGLNSLESRVSRDSEAMLSKSSEGSTESGRPQTRRGQKEGDQTEKGCGMCRKISGIASWVWKGDAASPTPRPALLGWLIILGLIWFFSECTMCKYYCHPEFDDVCEGNCLLPDAPRYPYVIPTMLWRWLNLSAFLSPLWTLLLALIRFLAQLLGLWDGYLDDEPQPIDLTGKIWIHGAQVGSLSTSTTPTARGYIPSLSVWPWKEQKTTESVPELNVQAASREDNWDDLSMDDDEVL